MNRLPVLRIQLFQGLGSAIAGIRQEKGLSQGQAARRGGASETAFSHWERGARVPRAKGLAQILAGLKCSLYDLEHKIWRLHFEYLKKLAEEHGLPPPSLGEEHSASPQRGSFIKRFIGKPG